MCGIVGAFARRRVIGDVEALCRAVNELSHRGPDDGAWWSEKAFFLGHRRLSIIDLEQGSQPMASTDGALVVVFNGEIYNFIELREELTAKGFSFATSSDTEVIIQGYRAWGVDVAKRLVGMFAFAIADRIANTLYLARDRFGEKPLFVHEAGGIVRFASELRGLAALPDVTRSVDDRALGEYLCLNYVPGDRTMMEGVRRLPQATWRLYGVDTCRQETYWKPPDEDPEAPRGGPDVVVQELRARLDDAIRIALRSDVPVALFLSGGVDSSVIAESAVRQGRIRHAYVLDFDESTHSEFDNAKLVASRLGLELRRVVLSPVGLNDFFAIVEHADDPLADSSSLAVWALSREVARDYKVVISGDGGDELFGGYLTYKATMYHRLLAAGIPRGVRDLLVSLAGALPVSPGKVTPSYKLMRFLRAANLPSAEAHFTWNGSWLPSQAAALLSDPRQAAGVKQSMAALALRVGLPARPSLGELQRADLQEYLPNDILTKVDRMTMAHGLEARAPFLVPGVAEYALRLPGRYKLGVVGQPKRILRRLANSLYGPRIAYARKQGFSIPVHEWLRGPARGLADDLLAADEIREIGHLDGEAVSRAKDMHMSGRSQLGFELWGLMVLAAWHRARIRGPRVGVSGPKRLRRVTLPLSVDGRAVTAVRSL